MKIIHCKDYDDMSKKAAAMFFSQIHMKPDSVLGLATGSTPIGTYKQLIKWYEEGDLDFSEVKSVNLDEYVGLDGTNDQSYRYFMNENLFNHVNINKDNTNVPNGKAEDMDAEALRYEALIKSLGGIVPSRPSSRASSYRSMFSHRPTRSISATNCSWLMGSSGWNSPSS